MLFATPFSDDPLGALEHLGCVIGAVLTLASSTELG